MTVRIVQLGQTPAGWFRHKVVMTGFAVVCGFGFTRLKKERGKPSELISGPFVRVKVQLSRKSGLAGEDAYDLEIDLADVRPLANALLEYATDIEAKYNSDGTPRRDTETQPG